MASQKEVAEVNAEQVLGVVTKLNDFTEQLSSEEQRVLVGLIANLEKLPASDDVGGYIKISYLDPLGTLRWDTSTGQVQWQWRWW